MMRPSARSRALALLVGSAWVGTALDGCSRGLASPAVPSSVPNLELPAPHPPRPPLPPELATLVYPDVEKVARDPFLTFEEQAAADGKPVAPVTPDPAAGKKPGDGKVRHRPPGPVEPTIAQKIIKQIKQQVHGIILGAPNIFIFNGRSYQEGDVIDGTDWVVVSVQESGIRLRSKDGSGSDYLPFATSSAVMFEFKKQ